MTYSQPVFAKRCLAQQTHGAHLILKSSHAHFPQPLPLFPLCSEYLQGQGALSWKSLDVAYRHQRVDGGKKKRAAAARGNDKAGPSWAWTWSLQQWPGGTRQPGWSQSMHLCGEGTRQQGVGIAQPNSHSHCHGGQGAKAQGCQKV